MTRKAIAWGGYLVAVHLALAAVTTKVVVDHLENVDSLSVVQAAQRITDAQVPAGAAVFLGDSETAMLAVAAVEPTAVNFGISGLRSAQLLEGMGVYKSMQRARRVYLMIGTNDVLQGEETGIADRYRALLAAVPPTVPVTLSSIPPVRGKLQASNAVAAAASAACKADARCIFVDLHSALTDRPDLFRPDGVHMTPAGYALWIPMLRHSDHQSRNGASAST